MLSPGFTDSQSDPLGHGHDALLESSPSDVLTVGIKHQFLNQLINALSFSGKHSADRTRGRVVVVFATTVFPGDAGPVLQNQVAWTTTGHLATR